jgi:hypothetical protein
VSALQKAEKLYLENTNLLYALQSAPEVGNVQETFLLNQLVNQKCAVSLPASGDFLVNDMLIEVGGKSKTARQVKSKDNYIVAADDIETGIGTKVPLWMLGMGY